MKTVLFGLFLILGCSFGWTQESCHFTIKGQLPDLSHDGSYVYLIWENIENAVTESAGTQDFKKKCVDSVRIQEGRFLFNREGDRKGELYTVKVQNSNISSWVVGEPGEIELLFKKMNEKTVYSYINGTSINDRMTNEVLIPSYIFASKVDSVSKGKISQKVLPPSALEYYKGYSGFIKTYIHYPVGEYLWIAFPPLRKEDQEAVLSEASEDAKQWYEKKQVALARLREFPDSVKAGQHFVDFALPTLSGNTVTLSEVVKNKKIVLLDFWASWCGPCLHEIPELVVLYDTYKDKKLEIIGISLDVETEPWKGAVERYKMSWPQIINQKVGEKNLSEIYGVTTIPHVILIDQSGKIISRGLRGKQLSEAIKQLIE